MTIFHRLVSLAALVGGLVLFAAPASAAALILTQKPCTTAGGGPCKSFGPGAVPPTVRSIQFNAPSKGKAAVSFTGSMFCANSSTSTNAVVDFATQIVPTFEAVPNLAGSGALRHATRIVPASGIQTFSTTFNLASTRVFGIKAAGAKIYFFNLAALRMDPTMSCIIYDAAFTIVFIP